MSTQPPSRAPQPSRPPLPVGVTFTPFFGGRGKQREAVAYDPYFPGAREAREAEVNRGAAPRR